MLSSLALRCNQYCSLVLMHLLLRTSQDCTARPPYRQCCRTWFLRSSRTAWQGHYQGSAVGLGFFRCSRTALQDHVTGSAVGLGFYCSRTALPRHYAGSAVRLVFFAQKHCNARPRYRQCCTTGFLLQQDCTARALQRQCQRTCVSSLHSTALQYHLTGSAVGLGFAAVGLH